MNNENTPYSNLDPNLILHAIESIGFQCTGSLLALNSYENRVYQVGIEGDNPLIAKFYRPGRWTNESILEEHQFSLTLAEYEVPVVPPLIVANHTLHEYEDFRFAVFPRQGGRALELENLEHLEWMGRFIARFHAIGACQPFKHRIRLDSYSYGHQPYQYLINHDFIPIELRDNFCHTVETLLHKIEQCFERIGSLNYIRLHGDCHAGNILWNQLGPQIVDLDDCLMGPAIQDLWMLITGTTEEEIKIQLDYILRGYEEFYDFDFKEIYLIEALRTLRMIHYAGWLAKRWQDPAFPLNFPWFNTFHYWQELLQNLNEQIALLDHASHRIQMYSN